MTIERRYRGAFDVYVPTNYGRTYIDTVFYTASTVDEVRRGLIGHDGYDSNIIVVPNPDNVIPLTDSELEHIMDENEVTVEQGDNGKWVWAGEQHGMAYGGNELDSKREAMLDAVDTMVLEQYLDADEE